MVYGLVAYFLRKVKQQSMQVEERVDARCSFEQKANIAVCVYVCVCVFECNVSLSCNWAPSCKNISKHWVRSAQLFAMDEKLQSFKVNTR